MTKSVYTGEVAISLGAKNCTLVYDWRAISAVHTAFKDRLEGGLLNVNQIASLEELAEILVIGLQRKNPEVTIDQILDLSPPLLQTRAKIDEAMAYAYFGADIFNEVEKAVKETEKKQPKKDTKKKTRKTK